MSSTRFTRDELRAALARKGVPAELIEKTLELELGRPLPLYVAPGVLEKLVLPDLRPPVSLPFFLVVPWSQLCSDNERKAPYIIQAAAGPRAAMRLSDRYEASMTAIAGRARDRVGDVEPSADPLRIAVDVWLPPSRRNDSINFAKVVGDALEGVVYANDNQLHDSHWVRRGVDIDAPRAEITISLL